MAERVVMCGPFVMYVAITSYLTILPENILAFVCRMYRYYNVKSHLRLTNRTPTLQSKRVIELEKHLSSRAGWAGVWRS